MRKCFLLIRNDFLFSFLGKQVNEWAFGKKIKLKYKLPANARSFYIPCLSPESFVNVIMMLAGLLACSVFNTFPSRRKRNSGTKIEQCCLLFIVCCFYCWIREWASKLRTTNYKPQTKRDYSYGDSAGFTPDFPFNHAYSANQNRSKSKRVDETKKRSCSHEVCRYIKPAINHLAYLKKFPSAMPA